MEDEIIIYIWLWGIVLLAQNLLLFGLLYKKIDKNNKF